MILLGIGLFIASYLSVGYLFHLVIFPEIKPNPKNYFNPGDRVDSEVGGTSFTVTRTEGEEIYVRLKIEPHAEGPPVHIHTGWDETFAVESGKMALMVDGQKKILSKGDSYTVKKGTPHKPFNPFDEYAELKEMKMPTQFLIYLNQM